jgi:hypothetical protein
MNWYARIVFSSGALVLLLGVPVAWACSSCLKSTLSAEDFDRQGWQQSASVVVGLVTRAEIHFNPGSVARVVYSVRVEESFKGNLNQFLRVYSTRPVQAWPRSNDLEEVSCGHLTISPGDRVLVFASGVRDVVIAPCSLSRVIEGVAAAPKDDIAATIARLRQWSRGK